MSSPILSEATRQLDNHQVDNNIEGGIKEGERIRVRVLPLEEWDKLVPIFNFHNCALPHPKLADIWVAERNSKIIMIIGVQWHIQIGPMYSPPDERGSKEQTPQIANLILDTIDNEVFQPGTAYLAISDHPSVKAIALSRGMKKVEGEVFIKEFR